MRALPAVTDRADFDALVVRTDHHDGTAWHGRT
jgi:hypothetical protein